MANLVTPHHLSIFKDNKKLSDDFQELKEYWLNFFGYMDFQAMAIIEPNNFLKLVAVLNAHLIMHRINYELDGASATEEERLIYGLR